MKTAITGAAQLIGEVGAYLLQEKSEKELSNILSKKESKDKIIAVITALKNELGAMHKTIRDEFRGEALAGTCLALHSQEEAKEHPRRQ